MKLPKTLYVKVEEDGKNSYLLCGKDIDEIIVDMGSSEKIGIYKLVTVKTAVNKTELR